jgi:hypothetical protein
VNEEGNVVMTVSNLDGIAAAQDYMINIEGSSTSVNQNITVKLSITASDLEAVILVFPAEGATGISLADTLTWQEDKNANSYIVEIASDEAFTNVVSSGEPTTNVYDVANLEGDTMYYWRVKANNSCNEGVFSSVFSFTTEIPSYCVSTFTDEVGGTEHITNVTFNTINNNSGNDTFEGYQDFTAVNTDVLRESNHTISVTFDTGGFQDHCYVFIDWNKDFVFDKNTERYNLGSKLENVSTATFAIKVPLDARFGKTRMRVLIEYYDSDNASGDGPCDADHLTEWGETEDYSVTIIDNTASIEELAFEGFNLFPNPTKGAFTLNFKLVNTDKVSVQLYDVRGRLITEKNYYNSAADFSEKIFFESASSGLYLLKVTNGNKQTTKKLMIK